MKTVEKIHAFQRFGSKLGLERMERLLALLGNPEAGLRIVHVAGTNGKGSVCRYLCSVLRTGGYRVGLYTSPFVVSFHERIEYEGQYITETELAAVTDAVLAAAKKMTEGGEASPTEFEIITAAAFLFFADKQPDYVVLEVGLGGRGDATNVVKHPALTVISSISLDHMDRLGESIPEIAAEKAGILKPGCPVVCGAKGEAAAVIAGKATEKDAPFFSVDGLSLRHVEKGISGYGFETEISGLRYEQMRLSMAGTHQVENALTALLALQILSEREGLRLSMEQIRRGMFAAVMPGRFEVVSRDPLVIIDGAHNADGAAALADTIRELFPGKRILTVVGLLNDKAADQILAAFHRFTGAYILTEPNNDRRMGAAALAHAIECGAAATGTDTPPMIHSIHPEPADAIATAVRLIKEESWDLIVCAGSLYLIGEIRRALLTAPRDPQ